LLVLQSLTDLIFIRMIRWIHMNMDIHVRVILLLSFIMHHFSAYRRDATQV
jgi:hypothetical protein